MKQCLAVFGGMWLLVIALMFTVAFGYGAANAVSQHVVEYKRSIDPDWNKRGYIRCVDGALQMGNLDISGLVIPEGEYVINLKSEYCKGKTE